MGDEVLIEIKNADLAKKQLDFILVDSLEKPMSVKEEWGFDI